MGRSRPASGLLSLTLLSLPLVLTSLAQGRQTPLPPGAQRTRDIAGAEVQLYRVRLDPREFFQVRVEQNGVDVALELVDASGNTLASMDSPNDLTGPETLSFIAATASSYVLEVSAVDPAAVRGSYTIKRQPGHAVTDADRKRVDVERLYIEGMSAREDGQLDAAIDKLGKAQTRWQELGDTYLADLTARELKLVKGMLAEQIFDEAYALFEVGTAESYQLALPMLAESTRLFEETGERGEKAGLSMLATGSIHNKLGDKREALAFFGRALTFFQQHGHKDFAATTLNNIAGLYDEIGDKQKALAIYESVLPVFKQLRNKRGEAITLNNIGLLYDSLAQKQKALEYYDLALPMFKELGDKRGEAHVIGNMASTVDDLGQSDKALELYGRALDLYRETGDKGGEAQVLNNSGLLYKNLGQVQRALDNYAQALKLFRLVGDKGGEADTINDIGAAYNDLGDTTKVLENYNLALAIYQQVGDKDGEATAFNNIGSLYNDLRERQKAIDHYNRALAIYRQIASHAGEVGALNNLGGAYDGMGDKARAMEFFEQALPIVRQIGDRRGEGLVLNNIGKVLVDIGELPKAIEYYGRSLPVLREVGDRRGEAGTLYNLMFALAASGNTQLAVFYGKQAVNTFQELRSDIKGLNKDTQKAFRGTVEHAYRKLADLLIAQGSFAQAETVLAMLKEEEFFDFVRRDAGEIAKLDQRLPLNEKEKSLITRYAQLADQVTAAGEEFVRLDDKKRQLSRSDMTLSPDEQKRYDELEKQLDAANAAFQLFLTKELVAEIGRERAKEVEVDRNLQSKLRQWGDGTVALYTVTGPDRYRVVLTTPKVQVDGKTDIKLADLNQKIFAFRNALQNPLIDPRPLGKELYDILVKPVEKQLKDTKAKTLVWSLDGTLRYIPLAALSPDGKKYMVEDVQNVIITPKTRDDMTDSNADWQGLGLGVSDAATVADPGDKARSIPFISLPGTTRELMSIVREGTSAAETGVLPGKRFMNKDFTVAAFKDALAKENPDGTRRYSLVHIASHFRLGSDWTSSFLLAGGGETLSLENINDSSTIDFGGVDLITLSACNTGFADDTGGKEIDSLASVIQTKGGKAVLATLWAVADESTALVMSEFYRQRKQNPKLTKAAAMQLAQQAMITGKLKSSGAATPCRSDQIDLGDSPDAFKCNTNAPFSHAYFWSPFVLIGNWR